MYPKLLLQPLTLHTQCMNVYLHTCTDSDHSGNAFAKIQGIHVHVAHYAKFKKERHIFSLVVGRPSNCFTVMYFMFIHCVWDQKGAKLGSCTVDWPSFKRPERPQINNSCI